MPRDSVRYSLKTGQSPHRHYHPKQNVGFFAHNSYGLAALLFVLKFAMAYNGRGSAKHYLKDYAGAIADYNKAIEQKPQSAATYNNRGNAKKNLGDYAGAMADYNKAIELFPQYTRVYDNLIELYEELNQPEKAEEILRLKQKNCPDK